MAKQADEDSVPEPTPVLSVEERKAQWEHATAKLKFIDMMVMAIRPQVGSSTLSEAEWDGLYRDASLAWEARERFIKGEST